VLRAAFLATVVLLFATVLGGNRYYSVKGDLMRTRKNIDDQWLGVVLALQQRADLIPRLVDDAQKHVPGDADVCGALSDARSSFARARSREETIAASQQIDLAVSRLLLASERYPQSKAKRKFTPLEDELAETDNRFLLARRKYNEALEHYNVEIQKFPANVVAGIAGFTRNDAYFKTEPGEREVPKVQR
jgi:LemA protein